MDKRNLIILSVIVLVGLAVCCIFIYKKVSEDGQAELGVADIMEIIKTDKDYNDLSAFINSFKPMVTSYIKLGPDEYKKIRSEWSDDGLDERIKIVDKINLTNFTYWIETKDRKPATKGFQAILDVKEERSLLLMAFLSIEASIGL